MLSITRCGSKDYEKLSEIWERSVRATHSFLTEQSIREIRATLIPDYFPNVELWAAVSDGVAKGFIGLSEDKIEMLFVDSDSLGKGIGTLLTEFAMRNGAVKVDVNEQNPSALGFYISRGFSIASRDAADDAGRPYPILHLTAQSAATE